jgi:chromate transporter
VLHASARIATVPPDDVSAPRRTRLAELAALFLRLGVTAFGGPAAHVALMEDEVVRRRGWLGREEFLDLLGATNLIPGPNSTEMAIHIGRLRAGTPGLVVAGACFILPAALIVAALAWAYVSFGRLPEVRGVLYGVAPVIIGVVVQALVGLARTAVKTRFLAAVGVAAMAACFAGVHELVVLLAAGALVMAWRRARASRPPGGAAASAILGLPALSGVTTGTAAAAASAPFGLAPLFLFFLKVGSVLFGSGYVLLAFLRADLVERLGWLSERQLLDAIAVGQVTPGPVFTTATFIGFVLGGPAGAALATLGIFLPAFVFVAASGWLVPRLRRSPDAAALLDGVNVASLALMAVVSIQLGRSALVDVPTVAIALVSAILLVRYRVNSAWLVLGGALVGGLVLRFG